MVYSSAWAPTATAISHLSLVVASVSVRNNKGFGGAKIVQAWRKLTEMIKQLGKKPLNKMGILLEGQIVKPCCRQSQKWACENVSSEDAPLWWNSHPEFKMGRGIFFHKTSLTIHGCGCGRDPRFVVQRGEVKLSLEPPAALRAARQAGPI